MSVRGVHFLVRFSVCFLSSLLCCQLVYKNGKTVFIQLICAGFILFIVVLISLKSIIIYESSNSYLIGQIFRHLPPKLTPYFSNIQDKIQNLR